MKFIQTHNLRIIGVNPVGMNGMNLYLTSVQKQSKFIKSTYLFLAKQHNYNSESFPNKMNLFYLHKHLLSGGKSNFSCCSSLSVDIFIHVYQQISVLKVCEI